ncbi:hypothetical protein AAFC00_000146 [Neodothiora populina]|uniref:F-box domain-containing protein n=1 Tax=Neodothiora populina TaxID=2781224 RepID=A0ABR3P1R5_9PEZI
MASSSAAQLVLDTPELLENIVSFLPPLELLVAQRVSQIWRGVITNSPTIQRLLFMRPDWSLETKSYNARRPINKPGERPRNNLMLRRILDGRYPTVTLKITSDAEQDSGASTRDDESSIDVPRKDKPSSGHWSWDVNITCPADRLPSIDPAVLYEHASWRKMYMCQPPCTSLHLVRRWQRSTKAAITCDTGIKMNLFMQKASQANEAWKTWTSSDMDYHYEGAIQCSSIQE